MKLRNIFLAGLSAVALGSCSDYLDVDAPSKLGSEYVYTDKKEMNRALNGVYAAMLTNDTYGQAFLEKLCFNTDVEFATNSNEFATSNSYRRYDCDPDGGDIKKAWDALFTGIERANMLDAGIRKSAIYDEDDAELMQMLGEVKVLRAIFYHDLVWYFGDVPFSMVPSYEAKSQVLDVVDRTVVLDELINDLKAIAPKMRMTTEQGFKGKSERIGKEMAWAMIARMALTAGGYSLRPDGDNIGKMERPENYVVNGKTYDYKDFYKTAADYCDSVMTKGGHTLDATFQEVFTYECNNAVTTGKDVIFEIPFGIESTGNIGYIHGPKMDNAAGTTVHSWGKASSSAQLHGLYRFMFEDGDVRRDYINQLFSYNGQGEATFNNGRTNYNGKWSKLWVTNGLGATTEGKTGINFPYMRYADVLLMYAEAINELENGVLGPNGQKAIEAYQQVRKRAFPNQEDIIKQNYMGDGSHDDFLEAVLNERKFEFAGENLRWRDLVRNNRLSEVAYWSFFRYIDAAEGNGNYTDYIDSYDFKDSGRTWNDYYITSIYYYNNVPNLYDKLIADKDGKTVSDQDLAGYLSPIAFPQRSQNMNIVRILNPYSHPSKDGWESKVRMEIDGKKVAPTRADYMEWKDKNTEMPRQELLYSMRGFVYCDDSGMFHMKQSNGQYSSCPDPSTMPDYKTLPPVRYILPYPRAVVTRSQGKYVNKYGYR